MSSKKREFIGVRIEPELKQLLREKCKENISECVRKILRLYLRTDYHMRVSPTKE